MIEPEKILVDNNFPFQFWYIHSENIAWQYSTRKRSGGYQALVLILVHSPSKYCKEIFNQKYEIPSGGGLFSMLQVWFINYKRTIIDRFAFPDKSTTKSTKLKLFLLPPKMYKGASHWNKFHPDQTVVKLFAYSKAGL